MGLDERRELYARIESHRKHPLIAYVTSKRDGVNASMATDALPFLIEELDALPAGTTEIDFLIASLGGDPMVAWRIISLIRERIDTVSVLIPQSAYSAATMVALGGNDIVMHPNGHLGPVDMQITTFSQGRPQTFSTEDITAFVEYVRKDLSITDQEHLRTLFEATCREVGSLGVGFTARNQRLAIELSQKLLNMPESDDDKLASANRAVVETLSRRLHSHGYPVGRKEAIAIGLPVAKERDPTLESLMWELWLDIESDLQERIPFDPIMELLNSPMSHRLLSPVPLASPNSTDPPDTGAMEPVDFETTVAVMESSRAAFRNTNKGKILSSTQPDLNLQWNMLVSHRGWEKKFPV